MPAKLILTWDIRAQHEQEYFEFVMREFLPAMQRMGFELTDAWVTAFGEQPQVLVGATMLNAQDIRHAVSTAEWVKLRTDLNAFIENFALKIAEKSGGFQF